MKTFKEGKLNIWNNNRISSSQFLMKKNHGRGRTRRWKTELLKHGKTNTEYHMMMTTRMISNNNRLMTCCSSSSPILKRHTKKKMIMDERDLIKKESSRITTISDLPEELLAEVLVRLSLKDIWACLCVQKSWLSLIKTCMFIALYSNYRHQQISRYNPNNNNNNKYLLFRLLFNGASEIRVDDIQCQQYLTLKYPPDQPQLEDFYPRLVSNGLICTCEYTFKTDHPIYLWNPVIQKVKTLPNSPHLPYTLENNVWKAIAFGFLPEINDYLVVYIVKHGLRGQPHTHSFVTCVYSLNTNSWRKITHNNVPDVRQVNKYDSFFVNGVAVWSGYNSQRNETIMCFDTKTDVLRELLLPECVSRTDSCYSTIHPFGESVVCFAQNEYSYNKVEMWVLKGDMMNEILWEKKVTVKFQKYFPVHVFGLRNNGDPILCNSYDMISYNLDSYKSYDFVTSWDSWTPFPCWDDTDDSIATPYEVKPFVESLALLNID